MRSLAIVLLSVSLSLFPQLILAASGDTAVHLFFIERSKNKNLVQYDVRLTENRDHSFLAASGSSLQWCGSDWSCSCP